MRLKQSHFQKHHKDPCHLPTIPACPPVEKIMEFCDGDVRDGHWEWTKDSDSESESLAVDRAEGAAKATEGAAELRRRRRKRGPLVSIAVQLYELGRLSSNKDRTFTIKDLNDNAHVVQPRFSKNAFNFHCSCNPTKECIHIMVVKLQLNMQIDDEPGNIDEEKRRHKPLAQRRPGQKTPRIGDYQDENRVTVNERAAILSDTDDFVAKSTSPIAQSPPKKRTALARASVARERAASVKDIDDNYGVTIDTASVLPPSSPLTVPIRCNLSHFPWFKTALKKLVNIYPQHLTDLTHLNPTRSNPVPSGLSKFHVVRNCAGEVAFIHVSENDTVCYTTAFDNCETREFEYHAACSARETKSNTIHVIKQACQTSDQTENSLALLLLQLNCSLQHLSTKNLHFSVEAVQSVIKNPKTFSDNHVLSLGTVGKAWTGQHKASVPLYCCCRMPHLSFSDGRDTLLELDDMCQCAKCKAWFFRTCKLIPKIYFRKYNISQQKKLPKQLDWYCSNCQVFTLPKVPRWSSKIATNTCTVDNILTIIFVYAKRHHPSFIQ